ncbi:MAG: hypothetical protein HQ564_07620 [Candidatus Saganbacteria bacterium]|nr:hypothetical protein [Candidatus Saganbacteria bacterium]
MNLKRKLISFDTKEDPDTRQFLLEAARNLRLAGVAVAEPLLARRLGLGNVPNLEALATTSPLDTTAIYPIPKEQNRRWDTLELRDYNSATQIIYPTDEGELVICAKKDLPLVAIQSGRIKWKNSMGYLLPESLVVYNNKLYCGRAKLFCIDLENGSNLKTMGWGGNVGKICSSIFFKGNLAHFFVERSSHDGVQSRLFAFDIEEGSFFWKIYLSHIGKIKAFFFGVPRPYVSDEEDARHIYAHVGKRRFLIDIDTGKVIRQEKKVWGKWRKVLFWL